MQVILSWLPGYMFDGQRLISTGSAVPPTMHINPLNGEVRYYCRPIFTHGPTVGQPASCNHEHVSLPNCSLEPMPGITR